MRATSATAIPHTAAPSLRWALWIGLVAGASCTGSEDKPSGDTGAESDADADTDADADADADSDSDADVGTAILDGTLLDATSPITTEVRLCRGALCRTDDSDGTGFFSFEQVPSEWHAFEVVAPVGLATVLYPLLFADDEHRTLAVDMFPLGPESALGPTPEEHPVGDGMYLTVGLDQLEPPLFVDPATAVSGVRVPEESWLPFDGVTGTVLAVWYVAPFDHHAIPAEGLPFRIVDEWALGDGAAVEVYIGSYEDSAWVAASDVAVSGGQITGNLPLTSTVILVQP